MDIYQYINSPEVADFWREKNHVFTAAEAAHIVNLCARLNFAEKCVLWEEIMREYPDCPFGEFEGTHSFLRQYIDLNLSLKDHFMNSFENAAYTYSVATDYDFQSGTSKYQDTELFFRDYPSVMQHYHSRGFYLLPLKGFIERYELNEETHIVTRMRMDVAPNGEMLRMDVEPNGEMLRMEVSDSDYSKDRLLSGFELEYECIAATPFSIGDIVMDITEKHPRPFILQDLPQADPTSGGWTILESKNTVDYWDRVYAYGFGLDDEMKSYYRVCSGFDLASWNGDISPQMEIEQRYIRKEITDVEKTMAFLKLMREQNTPSAP